MADIFFDKGVWWTWGFIGEEGARVMFPVEIIPKEQVSGRVGPRFYAKSANEPNVNLDEPADYREWVNNLLRGEWTSPGYSKTFDLGE